MLPSLLYEALKLEPRDALLWFQCADALEEQGEEKWARAFRGRGTAITHYPPDCLNSLYPASIAPDSPYVWKLVSDRNTNEGLTTLSLADDPNVASDIADVLAEMKRLGLDKVVVAV